MKLIVNIDEEEYITAKRIMDFVGGTQLEMYIANGTPIPDNATNGGCVEKLFCKGIYRISVRKNVSVEFKRDWWYAKYQKGGKE